MLRKTLVQSKKLLILSLPFIMTVSLGRGAVAQDLSSEIKIADDKVILEHYEEAEDIYKNIVDRSEEPTVTAYVQYKLGALFKRKNDLKRARQEFRKGLDVLAKAGQENHQIGKYLTQALKTTDE